MRFPRLNAWRGMAFFTLGGVVFATAILLGFWGPVSQAFEEGHTAEAQRLLAVFRGPLARAVVHGEELTRIDELHRLQKLPGVLRAEVIHGPYRGSLQTIPLVWEGRRVGLLGIQMAQTSLQRRRYRCAEQALTLIVLAGLAGVGVGAYSYRQRRRFFARLVRMLERWQRGGRRRRQTVQRRVERERDRWIRQAMSFATQGLVLLDIRQRVVAMNPSAQEFFQLPKEAVGKNWVELMRSPEWAMALRQTLDHPGERVPVPSLRNSSSVSLLTLATEERAPCSTWIILQ